MPTTSRSVRARAGIVVICGLLCGALLPAGVHGSQSTPPGEADAPEITDFIPAGREIGEGWIALHRSRSGVDIEGVADTEYGIYGGPQGARAWVLAFRVDAPAASFDSTWDAIEVAWFAFFSDRIYPAPVVDRATRSTGTNSPGCIETVSASGIEYLDGTMLGVVQCAVSEEVVLIASTTGNIDEIAGLAAATWLSILSLRGAGIDVHSESPQADSGEAECVPIVRFDGSNEELQTADVRTVNEAPLADRPSTTHDVVATILPGIDVDVTGEPVKDGVVTWYPVRWPRTGEEGFVLSVFLEVCEEEIIPRHHQ